MENRQEFRPLHVPPNRPRPLDVRFWWLTGIAIAVLFLACVAMAYAARHVTQF